MFRKTTMIITFAAITLLALTVLTGFGPVNAFAGDFGQELSEQELSVQELEERWQERHDLKINRINELVKEGYLTEEEGDQLIEDIQNRDFERGVCPVDGPRFQEGLRLKNHCFNNENSEEFGDQKQGTGFGFSRHHNGRGHQGQNP